MLPQRLGNERVLPQRLGHERMFVLTMQSVISGYYVIPIIIIYTITVLTTGNKYIYRLYCRSRLFSNFILPGFYIICYSKASVYALQANVACIMCILYSEM